jgi:hypothetical protein
MLGMFLLFTYDYIYREKNMSFSVEFNPYFYIFNLFAFKSNDERIMFIILFFYLCYALKEFLFKNH